MEILKLTVKREAFENILANKQGYVYLEANGYWIKRIAENKLANFNKLVASQAFKTYDEIEISCSKDKINCAFGAINTGKEDGSIKTSKDTGFVVTLGEFSGAQNTVKTEDETVDVIEDETVDKTEDVIETVEDEEVEQAPFSDADSDVDTDEPENVSENDEPTDVDDSTDDEEDEEADEEEEDDDAEPVNIDMLNDVVKDFIDTFDDNLWGNVYIVNRPLVIISGGWIVGTKQKVNTNIEEEIRIPIGKMTIQDPSNGTDDVAFIEEIEKKMYDLAMSGYVFIWKNECKIIQTENGRELLLRLTKKNILNR